MAKKRKVTVKVRRKVAVRRKSGTANNADTVKMKEAPTEVPSNGVVFRVKLKRKQK